jgi:hypothetical protein
MQVGVHTVSKTPDYRSPDAADRSETGSFAGELREAL